MQLGNTGNSTASHPTVHQWASENHRPARRIRRNFLFSSKIRPVIRVVFENFRRKLGFFDAFYQRLPISSAMISARSRFLASKSSVAFTTIAARFSMPTCPHDFDASSAVITEFSISSVVAVGKVSITSSVVGVCTQYVTDELSFASLARAHGVEANGAVPQEPETLPIRYFVRLAGWCRLCLLW